MLLVSPHGLILVLHEMPMMFQMIVTQHKRKNEDKEEDMEVLNDANYDKFAGYGGSLFSKDPYDKDDEAAVYDKRMEKRRAYREKRLKLKEEDILALMT